MVQPSQVILNLHELSNIKGIQTIFNALKGEAFDYAMDVYSNSNAKINEDGLLKTLESRFSVKLFHIQVANRFQMDSTPKSIQEYFSMLSEVKYIHERGYMSLEAIINRIIERSPSEIRTVLWAQSIIINNIFELSQLAENIIPLAYGSKGISTDAQWVQVKFKAGGKNMLMSGKSKLCLIHGKGSHESEHCKIILGERSIFLGRQKSADCIVTNEDDNSINPITHFSAVKPKVQTQLKILSKHLLR